MPHDASVSVIPQGVAGVLTLIRGGIVRVIAVCVLAVTLAACASMNRHFGYFRPGQGVTPSIAAEYGCIAKSIESLAATLKESLPPGRNYVPEVGWDACTLMAHNGTPTSIDHQQTATMRAQSWWYQSNAEVHLVTLQYTPGRTEGSPWVVTYVGW